MPFPPPTTTQRHVVVWGAWGAYHRARLAAHRAACGAEGIDATGLELFPQSASYGWVPRDEPGLVSLDLGGDEAEFPGLLALAPAVRHIRRQRPSVLFVPAYHHWSLALNLAGRLAGARVVIMSETTSATARPGRARRFARTAAVHTAGALLVGGTAHRRYFESLGVPADRIADGYDAVDNAFFEQVAAGAREHPDGVQADLGVSGPFILSVARLVPKKSLHTLVSAYALLRSDPSTTGLPSLVLIGTGPLREDLERQASALGIPLDPSGLVFVETFDERRVAAAMGVAEALVLPSILEEWGLVVNEAMAAGCPVVVSRAVGCVEDLVDDDVTGLLFDPGDASALAGRLTALHDDPALRARLATAASTRIAAWGPERFAAGALQAARIAQSRPSLVSRVGAWLRRRPPRPVR